MIRGTAVAVLLLVLGACSSTGSPVAATASPAAIAAGEVAFAANCAECHGDGATGTDQGPPLVNNIYRSSHHPDGSISLAVTRGVPQHHWDFGHMEPVDGLSDSEVTSIIAYIRQLQADAGIE